MNVKQSVSKLDNVNAAMRTRAAEGSWVGVGLKGVSWLERCDAPAEKAPTRCIDVCPHSHFADSRKRLHACMRDRKRPIAEHLGAARLPDVPRSTRCLPRGASVSGSRSRGRVAGCLHASRPTLYTLRAAILHIHIPAPPYTSSHLCRPSALPVDTAGHSSVLAELYVEDKPVVTGPRWCVPYTLPLLASSLTLQPMLLDITVSGLRDDLEWSGGRLSIYVDV